MKIIIWYFEPKQRNRKKYSKTIWTLYSDSEHKRAENNQFKANFTGKLNRNVKLRLDYFLSAYEFLFLFQQRHYMHAVWYTYWAVYSQCSESYIRQVKSYYLHMISVQISLENRISPFFSFDRLFFLFGWILFSCVSCFFLSIFSLSSVELAKAAYF